MQKILMILDQASLSLCKIQIAWWKLSSTCCFGCNEIHPVIRDIQAGLWENVSFAVASNLAVQRSLSAFVFWLALCLLSIDYRNILAGSRFVFIWQKMCVGSGARGQGGRAGALSLSLAPSLSFQSKQQEEVVNHSNVLSRNSDQQGEQRTHTHTTYGVSLQSAQRHFNQWKRANDTRSPITASHRKYTYHTSSLYCIQITFTCCFSLWCCLIIFWQKIIIYIFFIYISIISILYF